jgi:hypothetical protein
MIMKCEGLDTSIAVFHQFLFELVKNVVNIAKLSNTYVWSDEL